MIKNRKHSTKDAMIRMLSGDQKSRELILQLSHIGQLQSFVAHELRGIFTVIIGIGNILKKEIDEYEERKISMINAILDKAIYAESIAHHTLEYSSPVRGKEVCCSSIVDNILSLLEYVIVQKGVIVKKEIEYCKISQGVESLKIILMNICKNSVEAMKKGGELGVCLRTDENHLILEVHDDGPGFIEEQHDRMFDVFFTEKENGIGLGLAFVKHEIDVFKGSIEIRNKEDGGMICKISIPLSSLYYPYFFKLL